MADPSSQVERMAQQQAARAIQLSEFSEFIDQHGVDASSMSAEQKRLAEAMVLAVAQLMGTQSHNIVKEAFDSENDTEGYSDRLSTFLRLIRQVLADREMKSLADNVPLEEANFNFQPLAERIMAIGKAQVSEIYLRPDSRPGSLSPAERRSSQLFSPSTPSPAIGDVLVAPTRQIALHVKLFPEEDRLAKLTPVAISLWLKSIEKWRRENHSAELALNTTIDKDVIDPIIERVNQMHPIVPGSKLAAAMTKVNFYQHCTGPSSTWSIVTVAQRNDYFLQIVVPAVLYPRSAQAFASMTQQVLDELYLNLAPTDLESYPSDGALAANYLVLSETFQLLQDVLEYSSEGSLKALSEQGSIEEVNKLIGQLYYHWRHDAAKLFPAPKVNGRDQGNDHMGKPRRHEGLVKMIKDKIVFDTKPLFSTHSREIEGIMVVAYDSVNLAQPSATFDNLARYKAFLAICAARCAEQRQVYMTRLAATELRLAKTIDKPPASLVVGRTKLYAAPTSTFKVGSSPRPQSPDPALYTAYPSRFAKASATNKPIPLRSRWSPTSWSTQAQGSASPVQKAGLFALTENEDDQPALVDDSGSEDEEQRQVGSDNDDPYGDCARQQDDVAHFASMQEDDRDENPLLSPYCFLSESSEMLAAMATRSGAPREPFDNAGQDARKLSYTEGQRHYADPRLPGAGRRIEVQHHTRGVLSAEDRKQRFCFAYGKGTCPHTEAQCPYSHNVKHLRTSIEHKEAHIAKCLEEKAELVAFEQKVSKR